jgi:hypothetical protein
MGASMPNHAGILLLLCQDIGQMYPISFAVAVLLVLVLVKPWLLAQKMLLSLSEKEEKNR